MISSRKMQHGFGKPWGTEQAPLRVRFLCVRKQNLFGAAVPLAVTAEALPFP